MGTKPKRIYTCPCYQLDVTQAAQYSVMCSNDPISVRRRVSQLTVV
jgi:hypothetical protein